MKRAHDAAVIGAGVFGAWTALTLRRRGLSVLLMDAYGPANHRASSGGESRIIRLGYGGDEIYTRWAAWSLPRWKELSALAGEALFHQTAVLWLARNGDPYEPAAMAAVRETGAAAERLEPSEIASRFPQFALDGVNWALLEPEAGVLMARRAVEAVVRQAVSEGVEYCTDAAMPPQGAGRLQELRVQRGAPVAAGAYVFACGAWLPKMFPELLAGRFFISRQEVFFFGAPAGNPLFAPPAFPTWICRMDGMYGMPDLESRGVKIACDTHGGAIDPDTDERIPSTSALSIARRYLARRIPLLRDAPLVESRVCQYENTSSGDFLVDRHPEAENVWVKGARTPRNRRTGKMKIEQAKHEGFPLMVCCLSVKLLGTKSYPEKKNIYSSNFPFRGAS